MAATPFDEVRESLTNALGVRRLRDGLWKDLVHSRYVELVANGRWPIEALANQYLRKEEDLFPPKRARREPLCQIDPDARARALAEIVACRLARFFPVLAFRQTHLKDELLPESTIADWVEERARQEGPPGEGYFSMPVASWKEPPPWLVDDDRVAGYARWLAEEAARVAANPKAEIPSADEWAPRQLHYGVPGEPWRAIAIRGDGVLAQLRSAASGMLGVAHAAGWSEAQAVAFILSGWLPPLPKASVAMSSGVYRAARRLVLRVNPRLAPREVAALYSKAREGYAGGTDRAMDDKHLKLAVFTEKNLDSGAPWLALREQWNGAYPQWRYATDGDPHARRFSLEARTARARLTGERWPSQRQRIVRGSL